MALRENQAYSVVSAVTGYIACKQAHLCVACASNKEQSDPAEGVWCMPCTPVLQRKPAHRLPTNLMLGVTLLWTSIPSGGSSLHATETGISSGPMSHLSCMQTLPFTLPIKRTLYFGIQDFILIDTFCMFTC